jgi:hypothetical protein
MANEPSILDVADEEFAQINKPEQKQEQGSILDIADDEFKKQEEESTQKEFDVAKLEKLKAEGKPLSEVQQRMIFDEQDKVPLLEQAGKGIGKFLPVAAVKVGELARGAYELAREGAVKPVYVGAKYHLGLATPEETNIAARGAEIAGRSAVSGVMSDLEDTAGTIIKGYESGSSFTDKLQGLSADERFKRYRWRERFQGYQQARRDENPDRAAAILAENVLLQKAAGIAAKLQGGTEEDAKEAEKAYSELVLESGLTREELNPYISSLGEVISPISIPGANIATKGIGKYTGKAVQKGGELALKGVVKPIATGVEKVAELTEKGITGVQTGARKLGEYVTGDPDTLIRGGSIAGLISAPQITGTILAAKPAAIATKEIARTFKDIASAVDVGGAAGRRGLVERGGAKPNAGALTKRLFSAESRGGLGRARAADWMIRQGNAITQQGVNGAVLNTILGLPDIESIEQGFEAAGSGFGIGAFTGSRIMERAGAVIDPRTGLAQKIDTIITPDPSSRRADEDADIKRFLSSVDPDLVPKMEKLGSIDERKKAIQSKVDALEKQKNVTFGPEVELIKKEIIRQKQNIEKLDKSTPQTQKEILRQIHLAFADEMDLAKTTGKAAGLNNIQVKILDPSEMEGFFRNSYGATLTDAESVIASLTGNPDLSPQESENLINSRRIVDGFYNEVGSAQSARGLAISEGSDLEGNEVPAFMRKKNLQGATIVINGDLVKQLSNEGFNIRNVVGHEMQHALGRFTEVRDMLAPLRRELFDQNIVNDDGTVNKVTQGIYSDDKLDAYADTYAASMSPSDNGESFKSQFGGDQNKLRAYIKEEILSEIAGRSGNVSGGTRAGLDSIGRQVVDWIEVNTQNGALKKIKETLRKGGIIVDDSGDISTVLGAELTPESLAMIRQYQRQLKNLNQSMVYEEDSRKEEVEIPITKILSDRTLQEKFKNSDIFEKEQVATMTAPDGSKQEIPIPPNAGVDPFVGTYRIQGGQLVDESGNPMNLGPNITFGTMPDGTQVEVGTRIARNVDGSPKILSNREIEARSRNRGKVIRNAIDSALSKGALQLEDTGNGNYRGVMSEAQVNAVLALPNTIVSPNLKRQILFVNEILRRKDGTRMYMEYQAAMRGGKSRALAPQIRDEIPIGFQFSKQGNFLITTMSVSRMHDKMNAWLAKKPENLKLWNGDTASFWDDVIKVLDNHSKGERGETGLDPDAAIALEKKNAVNDLFNVWNADTKAANPRRTKLPVQKGKDPIDVIVRSRRIDRINQYNESSLKKMPFNYELNTKNYMPAENPLADFQTPEDFANELPSVTAEEIRNAINTGNLDQVESRLREGDDLKPAESLDEKDGNIRIVSMFDNEFMPEESLDFVDVKPQFMPAETERYPTSERGMYSGLQKTIDEKVQGKFASPDQLKAIVTNPQNAKAEELKWSGVLGEIDRLAAENNGKVPKDKVMDYLRNEGAVKFEEVTLGGKEAFDQNRLNQLEAEYRNLKDHPIDDPSFGEDKYDELIKLMNIRDQSTTDTLYSEAERVMALAQQAQRRGDKKTAEKYFRENEFLNTRAEKLDLQGQGLANPPRFAGLQLPGGTNYREVVMTMPDPKLVRYNELNKIGATYMTDEQFAEYKQLEKSGLYKNQYTSSHFPETPNYVAHMRLNERTDAQGNEGLFVEEFQSDRHQAGREEGYKDKEAEQKLEVAKEAKRNFVDNVIKPTYGTPPLATDSEYKHDAYRSKWSDEHSSEFNRLNDNVLIASDNVGGIPDAPFRKDWSIQLFKRALRDAVDADKKWIGWTTGIEQVKRYEEAMRQAVDEITWNTPKGYQKAFAAIKDGNTILTGKINDDGTVYDFSYDSNFADAGADANGKQLSEVLGKEVASKILAENSGTATGDDLTVGGEGMKGFYDTILPKEIGKYVAKMGGKVEKSEITTQKESTWTQVTRTRNAVPKTKISPAKTTPIWRVDITPEMAGKVRGGQLQFMPAEQPTEYEPISARIRPLQGISAPTKQVGAKALSLGEIEPPVRGKAMLPDIELKPDISPKIDENTELPLNPDGTVTLYHGTTKDSAKKIIDTGLLKSRGEPDVYFTTAKEGTGYGDGTVIAVNIDPKKLIIDDEFPDGRKDFRVPVGKSKQLNVSAKTIEPDISEKGIQSSDIITSAKPAPDAVIKPFSNALVSSAGLINFLPAFHGTPFDVDKFKLANIGTGEGAQAYGWGLYFAQARKVAQDYKDKLTDWNSPGTYEWKGMSLRSDDYKNPIRHAISLVYHQGINQAKQIGKTLQKDSEKGEPYTVEQGGLEYAKKFNDALSQVKSKKEIKFEQGNLYKVDLDVKDEDLLDWDKPLSEQSEKIRNIIKQYHGVKDLGALENRSGSAIYIDFGLPSKGNAESIQKQASSKLLELGIPGIRYLDGTSRFNPKTLEEAKARVKIAQRDLDFNPSNTILSKILKDEQNRLATLEKEQQKNTYNYVIFDENLITILDKNDKPIQGELPRSTGLQFMPAEGAKKPKTAKKEPKKKKEAEKQYITIDSGDDETVPVLQEIRNGKPLTDPKGDPKFVQQKYELLASPFIDNYSGNNPEDTTKPNYDELAYDVSGVAQKKINSAIDSGAVDAAANIMVSKTNEAMKNADISAGSGWYSRMRENLLNALGVEGRELLSQLLGATSAKTPVNENFLQAMDGYEGMKSGRYDSNRKAYLEMINAENKNELNDLIDDRNYIAVIKNKISDLNKAAKKATGKKQKVIQSEAKKLKELIAVKPEDRTKKNRFSIVINASGLMPLRSNGKKFNANSMAVMKVIAGTWLDNRKAPKTPNFAGNLSGRTVQATIDVWAARFMRQILHEGSGTPWRIQPKSETGVTNEDFALGQVVMQRAAKKLGMNPDDLQAILWFAEKHNWDDRGWTGTEGAEKSSFDEIFSVFFPKGKKPLTFSEASEVLKSQKNKDESIDEQIDEETDGDTDEE